MSADISAARGVSAPETSEALWATDGLDLSTSESYAAGSGVAQRRARPYDHAHHAAEAAAQHVGRGRCAYGTTAGGGFVARAPMARHGHGLSVGIFPFLYLHHYTGSAPTQARNTPLWWAFWPAAP